MAKKTLDLPTLFVLTIQIDCFNVFSHLLSPPLIKKIEWFAVCPYLKTNCKLYEEGEVLLVAQN